MTMPTQQTKAQPPVVPHMIRVADHGQWSAIVSLVRQTDPRAADELLAGRTRSFDLRGGLRFTCPYAAKPTAAVAATPAPAPKSDAEAFAAMPYAARARLLSSDPKTYARARAAHQAKREELGIELAKATTMEARAKIREELAKL